MVYKVQFRYSPAAPSVFSHVETDMSFDGEIYSVDVEAEDIFDAVGFADVFLSSCFPVVSVSISKSEF